MKNLVFKEAVPADAEALSRMESVCFPANEAEKLENISRRLNDIPGAYVTAHDAESGTLIGCICGVPTDEDAFRDDFFTNTGLYSPEGTNVILLSLEVLPEYRGTGAARALMEHFTERARKEGRRKLILTCHDALIGFYESMGFHDNGTADSNWGGESWHEMVKELREDIRLQGQERFLMGLTLYRVEFPDFWKKSYAEKNPFYQKISEHAHMYVAVMHEGEEYLEGEKIQRFWHEHCEFCMEKAEADKRCVFYCTKDLRRWICEDCFEDFKDRFGWVALSSDELFGGES